MINYSRRSGLQSRLFAVRSIGTLKAGAARGILFALTLFSLFTLAGVADAAQYVMADGRRVELNRSTTEFGIVFQGESNQVADQGGLGAAEAVLEDFLDNPNCPVKIARVPDTSDERREILLNDPAIADVRPVYYFSGAERPVITTGTLVAKVRPGFSQAELNRIWAQYGVEVVEPIASQPDVYLLAPKQESDLDVEIAEQLAQDPRTEWAQPNLRRPIELAQVNIADEFFSRQWHLQNTGQQGGTIGADIDAVDAWTLSTGEGVLFGMFDDSVDILHEDLRGNYVGIGQDAALPELVSGYRDPSPKFFEDRHGTSVMGLAVAQANNRGGRGVAFDARWTATRGLLDGIPDVILANAYAFAMEEQVDVHINSWGFVFAIPTPQVLVNQIRLAFRQGRPLPGTDTPRGMVILFSSGNQNSQFFDGLSIASIPEVLAIGSSTERDDRASYSNFGTSLNVLAPGGSSGTTPGRPLMFTTDNMDRPDIPDPGYNWGGFLFGLPEFPEPDPTGSFTAFFNGTSAACPVAAGVAGLVLSANPLLTATDVRMILEHTAEKIQPAAAGYDGITSHSLRYGYGRVNAHRAVQAAINALSNGQRTWPSSPARVTVVDGQIRFRHNEGTDQYLVVQSDANFDFIPEDGRCYDQRQLGCEDVETNDLTRLPRDVTVMAVGCGLRCGQDPTNSCNVNDRQCVEFTETQAKKYFAIYGYSSIGRYSWGVAADSDGNVRGSGVVLRRQSAQGPAVTIKATPIEGNSPLTVQLQGNAVTEPGVAIDETRTEWNFDESADPDVVDATTRSATHTYTAAAGQTRTFVARLRMFDALGNSGEARVGIRVAGPAIPDDDVPSGSGSLRIKIGLSGVPGSDITQGQSPLGVVLSVDAIDLPGTVQSISWDLGDGTVRSGLTISHTYVNESDTVLSFPITATVRSITTSGMTVSTSATKLIAVLPGQSGPATGRPNLPGTGVPGSSTGTPSPMPCGAVGMIPLFTCVISLTLLRRRW
jgi:subtilisin family serine protease/PKD repeat protein